LIKDRIFDAGKFEPGQASRQNLSGHGRSIFEADVRFIQKDIWCRSCAAKDALNSEFITLS
jgi:hypothetical protein